MFEGIIFLPQVNHYTALVYKINNDSLNIKNKSFYFDDIKDERKLCKLSPNNFIDLINSSKDNNLFIIIEKKN